MSELVLAPLLVPLTAAALGLLAWRSLRAQRVLALVGTAVLVVLSIALLALVEREGVVSLQLGGWPAPYGITFVADLFSAILVLLTAVIGLAGTLYASVTLEEERTRHGFYPVLLVLLASVSGTFLTGDLFNLYVWFELMLIASFVLLAAGGERAQLEGALKYVALNLVASTLLLVTVGVLYGLTGTLNLADLSTRMPEVEPGGIATGVAVLLLVAFGVKAALVPLFFWLPASYPAAPVAVTAIFAGLLTKVGIYALVRLFTLVLPEEAVTLQPLLLAIAAATMVLGVLGAVAQHEMRRLLSFHIVSQMGYLVMGLAFFSVSALAGVIFFLVHVAVAKSTLFLVAGMVERLTGTSELARTGGLYASRPGIAILFGVAALSLAGVPPFSGFLAKLALVQAGIAADQLAIVLVSLLVSVLTLYSMLKIWDGAFWKPLPRKAGVPAGGGGTSGTAHASEGSSMHTGVRLGPGLVGPVALLSASSIALAVAAGPAFELVEQAARQLMDPSIYVDAVLGGSRR